jgi:hypothetical protein
MAFLRIYTEIAAREMEIATARATISKPDNEFEIIAPVC